MGVGTILLYIVAAVIGTIVLFYAVCFGWGLLTLVDDTLRKLFGLRPRSELAADADNWVWKNGTAIRKRTVADQLEIIRARNKFKQNMTDSEKTAYKIGAEDGWESGLHDGQQIGYREGRHS